MFTAITKQIKYYENHLALFSVCGCTVKIKLLSDFEFCAMTIYGMSLSIKKVLLYVPIKFWLSVKTVAFVCIRYSSVILMFAILLTPKS